MTTALPTASALNQPISLSPSGVILRSRVALAPMAGLTDVPFRTLAWGYGAGHMVSEMVTSKAELWDTGKSKARRVLIPGVMPQAVQIAGYDPQVMADSAQRLVDEGVQLIDINFGCPAKKVCRKAAGSALLGDIDLIQRIVESVATAVSVPVTVKTRTGLTLEDTAGAQAALAAQNAGAQMVVMHTRSKACRFNGHADPSRVCLTQQSLQIPLLVNGDVADRETAVGAMADSGADGVMIGRQAIGQPWIFAQVLGLPEPTAAERVEVIGRHLVMLHEFYGSEPGARVARKHMQAYMKRWGTGQLIPSFMAIEDGHGQLTWLAQHREYLLTQAEVMQPNSVGSTQVAA
ncbi:tRNA-dihydrouridine synthase [Pseudomonadales bacterium]|nr:tRNA-dihydrouridine synthase [Pseudomonadales bacterium]